MRAHPNRVFLRDVGVFVLERESERQTERNEYKEGQEQEKCQPKVEC